MIQTGVVTMASGSRYRVNISGSVSAPIQRLTGALKEQADGSGNKTMVPPSVGDSVLCWFPGYSFSDGCIIGILEGSQ